MVPGLVRPDRVWRVLPDGASFVDPASGALYYPGMSLLQLTIADPTTGEPKVIYYAVPNSAPVRDPSFYQALMARAVAEVARRARAEQAAAEAAAAAEVAKEADGGVQKAPETTAEPPSRKRGGLISRLSPMLGGPKRVSMRFVVGEARLRLGKSTGAALAFEQAAAEAAGDPTPLLARAIALTAQGDYGGAAASLRLGLKGGADLQSLHVDWSVVLGSEDMAQSVQDDLRRRAGGERPDDDAVLMLAFHLFAAGRDGMAIGVLGAVDGADDAAHNGLQAAAMRRVQAKAAAPAGERPPAEP